jgi:hypothetical protein
MLNMPTPELLQLIAPILVIQFILIVFCLFKLRKDTVKFIPKWAWALVIIFGNTVGPIIYLIIGRERD